MAQCSVNSGRSGRSKRSRQSKASVGTGKSQNKKVSRSNDYGSLVLEQESSDDTVRRGY